MKTETQVVFSMTLYGNQQNHGATVLDLQVQMTNTEHQTSTLQFTLNMLPSTPFAVLILIYKTVMGLQASCQGTARIHLANAGILLLAPIKNQDEKEEPGGHF
ncbi:hypothetical protein llap_12321 [Limosa lapponica baueri]|uniref:Uncharacterized protein n=1 Tax=Limosa lapponica baueri TaxID=1758121 RepID=A0A2I0TUA7_LIMLA|nr:hypothetical protein llap_12321 [Limosa lapponica baueri]